MNLHSASLFDTLVLLASSSRMERFIVILHVLHW